MALSPALRHACVLLVVHHVRVTRLRSLLLLVVLAAVLAGCSSSGSSSGAPLTTEPVTTEPVRKPTDIVALARAAGCENPTVSPDTGDTVPDGPLAPALNPLHECSVRNPADGLVSRRQHVLARLDTEDAERRVHETRVQARQTRRILNQSCRVRARLHSQYRYRRRRVRSRVRSAEQGDGRRTRRAVDDYEVPVALLRDALGRNITPERALCAAIAVSVRSPTTGVGRGKNVPSWRGMGSTKRRRDSIPRSRMSSERGATPGTGRLQWTAKG